MVFRVGIGVVRVKIVKEGEVEVMRRLIDRLRSLDRICGVRDFR